MLQENELSKKKAFLVFGFRCPNWTDIRRHVWETVELMEFRMLKKLFQNFTYLYSAVAALVSMIRTLSVIRLSSTNEYQIYDWKHL